MPGPSDSLVKGAPPHLSRLRHEEHEGETHDDLRISDEPSTPIAARPAEAAPTAAAAWPPQTAATADAARPAGAPGAAASPGSPASSKAAAHKGDGHK